MVILHGGPGFDHSYFLPQMENLSSHYKLIFYDQRGCGRSSVKVDNATITMNQFVEDLEALRLFFKLDKMNLMGHSFGGLIAMRYAIKYPDHLNTLLLVNSSAASSAWRDSAFVFMEARKSPEVEKELSALKNTQGFIERKADTMSLFYKLAFKKSFYDHRKAEDLNMTLQPTFPETNKLMDNLFKDTSVTNYDLNTELRKLKVQTLIVGTEADVVPPLSVEDLHNNIKGSTYTFIESCGHFPFIEQPDLFLKAIDKFFLGLK